RRIVGNVLALIGQRVIAGDVGRQHAGTAGRVKRGYLAEIDVLAGGHDDLAFILNTDIALVRDRGPEQHDLAELARLDRTGLTDGDIVFERIIRIGDLRSAIHHLVVVAVVEADPARRAGVGAAVIGPGVGEGRVHTVVVVARVGNEAAILAVLDL